MLVSIFSGEESEKSESPVVRELVMRYLVFCLSAISVFLCFCSPPFSAWEGDVWRGVILLG